jgi:hypothetical protein
MSSPVIRKYALGLLIVSVGTGLRPVLCQQATPTAKRPQATLTINVQVQPVIRTPDSRHAQKSPEGASITYNFPRPSLQMTSFEETVTMTDESGHEYLVRRTTVVAE